MSQKFDTNQLRALAGGILLLLSLACVITKNESQTMAVILVALASFLVGGAYFGKTNISQYEQDQNNNDTK